MTITSSTSDENVSLSERQLSLIAAGDATRIDRQVYTHDDQGRADLLIDKRGTRLRYLYDAKYWMVWDGKRWHEDEGTQGGSGGLAAQVWTDLVKSLDPSKVTKSGGSQRTVSAVLRLASNDGRVRVARRDFDAKLDLLAFRNGTLNLQTREFTDHHPEDLLIRRVAAYYHPDATCPQWSAALDEWTCHDAELRGLLERAVGYTLSGRTHEKKLFLLIGGHDAGKSKFVDILAKVLGSYAKTVDQSLLTGRSIAAGRAYPELADLPGVRMAKMSETAQNARLNAERVKLITGGERMATRQIFGKPFEFDPQVKIWLASNDRPRVSSVDDALWGRLVEIPFNARFKKDNSLEERLLAERDGIATWAVQCYWQYLDEGGLGSAAASEEATAEHREDEDVVREWLDDSLQQGLHNFSPDRMRRVFNTWAKQHSEDELTQRRFRQAMEQNGWQQSGSGGKNRRWTRS